MYDNSFYFDNFVFPSVSPLKTLGDIFQVIVLKKNCQALLQPLTFARYFILVPLFILSHTVTIVDLIIEHNIFYVLL